MKAASPPKTLRGYAPGRRLPAGDRSQPTYRTQASDSPVPLPDPPLTWREHLRLVAVQGQMPSPHRVSAWNPCQASPARPAHRLRLIWGQPRKPAGQDLRTALRSPPRDGFPDLG